MNRSPTPPDIDFQPASLDDESPEAFAAFCVYVGMPAEMRSLRAVAAHLEKSKSLIERWSARHQWLVREHEWESQKAADEIARKDQKLQERQRLHASQASLTLDKAFHLVEKAGGIPAMAKQYEQWSIQRLYVYCERMNRLLTRLLKAERVLYTLLKSLEPKLAEEDFPEPTSRGRKDGTVTLVLAGCECGKEHKLDYEKWPCESAKAYAAFCLYRDSARRRSQRATARACGRARIQIERWVKRYAWTDRVAGWERHCRRVVEGTDIESYRGVLEKRLKEVVLARENVMVPITIGLRRSGELKHIDIVELLKMGMRSASQMGPVLASEREAGAFGFAKLEIKGDQTKYVFLSRAAYWAQAIAKVRQYYCRRGRDKAAGLQL